MPGSRFLSCYFFRQPQAGAQFCACVPQPQGSQAQRAHLQASGLMGAFVMGISLVDDEDRCKVRTTVRSQA